MDFVKKGLDSFNNNNNNENQQQNLQGGEQQSQQPQQSGSGGGFFDGLKNKVNEAAGGGAAAEKNEDYLDKGIDYVQENFLGQGPQNNESALEQAKDEQIANYIRKQYKSSTGQDFPIPDKKS